MHTRKFCWPVSCWKQAGRAGERGELTAARCRAWRRESRSLEHQTRGTIKGSVSLRSRSPALSLSLPVLLDIQFTTNPSANCSSWLRGTKGALWKILGDTPDGQNATPRRSSPADPGQEDDDDDACWRGFRTDAVT